MSSHERDDEVGFRVLVVEDNRSVRQMLRFSLRDTGFQVSEATSGVDALEILNGQPLAAVVLDLGLSDNRGQDVLDWLRQRELGGDGRPPVWVVVSALDQDDATRRYGPLGHHFLAKPFDPWVLVGLLQELLGGPGTSNHGDQLARGPATSLEPGDGKTGRQQT